MARERIETVVIGGGQAGLSVGYHLQRAGVPFVILDKRQRVGDSWRERWDSLRLFSQARFNSLDGLRFPTSPTYFPTKDEMASYLESYARQFDLPVRTGALVRRVAREGDGYLVTTNTGEIAANHVIVAMSNYQEPNIPSFADALDPGIVQLHSSSYRDPSQLRPGPVLIVGGGNSGAEIAKELVKGHQVYLSGPVVTDVPFRPESFGGRHIFMPLLFRVLFHRILTINTPVGRKARPGAHSTTPLIRVKTRDLTSAGVTRVPRTTGVDRGRPVVDGGNALDVANVVWCTGFEPEFSFLKVTVASPQRDDHHVRGVVTGEPGLYFVGLHFQFAMSSAMVHGVGRDAAYVAGVVADRVRQSSGRPSNSIATAGAA